MNVCVESPSHLSRAMFRVAAALAQYAPAGVKITRAGNADLIFLHVVGYEAIEQAKKLGKPYVVLQYCLKTTQQPTTLPWVEFWARAKCVYSYYNLMHMMIEDGVQNPQLGIDFVYGPLGVDPFVFKMHDAPKRFIAACSGYVADSECLQEVADAAAAFDNSATVFHLGPKNTIKGRTVLSLLNISDTELATLYSSSAYVTGLRRIEGFELPLAEGLLCGARPVTFNNPIYHQWYGDYAEYIEEGSSEHVTSQLLQLFRGPYRKVTEEERLQAVQLFSWQKFAESVWRQTLQ